MKKILTLSLLALAVVAGATPVMFPLSAMFGGGNYNRPFRIDSARPLLTDNTSIYVGSFYQVMPTGGTNPVVQLTPNDYLVSFQDARTPWRISVPNTNIVQNALQLTSSNTPLPTYVYSPPGGGFNPTGFSGTVTNLASIATIITTNQSAVTNNGWTLTLSAPTPFYFQAVYFENSNLTATAGGNFFGGSNNLVTLTLTTNEVRDGWMNLDYQAGATQMNIDVPFVGVAGVGNYSTPVAYTNYTQVNNAISGGTFYLTCVASNSVSYATNLVTHFNLTTFTNGVSLTNILQ
jgi:hypothetical protein